MVKCYLVEVMSTRWYSLTTLCVQCGPVLDGWVHVTAPDLESSLYGQTVAMWVRSVRILFPHHPHRTGWKWEFWKMWRDPWSSWTKAQRNRVSTRINCFRSDSFTDVLLILNFIFLTVFSSFIISCFLFVKLVLSLVMII